MINIREDIRRMANGAMRSGDKQKVVALRMLGSEIDKHEIENQKSITQEEFIQLLNRMRKQHQTSMDQFKTAGRDDLYQKEALEKGVIESLLPEQLSDEEVIVYVDEAIKTSDAQSLKDMGRVMIAVKDKVFGRVDMGKLSGIIKARLDII